MTTALITGASSGIGAQFARQLADRGHDLVLVARDEGRLRALAEQPSAQGGVEVEVLAADLSDRAATERVRQRVADPQRPIEILVNNAGFGLKAAFLDNDLADEERGLDVMARAVLVLCHAAGRAMRERGHGQIINVSSVAGWIASGTYSAQKSFVTVFTESLWTQLRGTGVTATAVCPGFTHTEFHERADLPMEWLPEWLWLSVEELVTGALADADAGKAISVPGRQWKVISTLTRAVPRPLLRSSVVSSRHRKR